MIPRLLFRTVPEDTSPQVELWWRDALELHPRWEPVTYRDPVDRSRFPLTCHVWDRCTTGAQLAGFIRLEALWWHGGIYLDSDVEVYRPLDPLRGVSGFAAWEDVNTIPDAVLGFTAQNPAIWECLDLALARFESGGDDWRTGAGAWATGPGVTTTVLKDRADVLLLPPAAFYAIHYSAKVDVDWSRVKAENPWSFGAHRWHASWLAGVQ